MMSFAEYLNQWMKNNALFEKTKDVAAEPQTDEDKDKEKKGETGDISDLFTIIKEKIGGDINDNDARNTSFEAIRQTLDGLDPDQLSNLEKSKELAVLVKKMTEAQRLPFIQAYLKNLRSNLNKISSEKRKFKHGEDFKKFYNLKARESLAINRIYKLYTIFNYLEKQPDSDLETATLLSIRETGNKLRKKGEERTFSILAIGGFDEGLESNEFEVKYEDDTTEKMTKEEVKNLIRVDDEGKEVEIDVKIAKTMKDVIRKLSKSSEDAIKKEVAESIEEDIKKIDEIPDTEEGRESLEINWKPLIDVLGAREAIQPAIEKKEKTLPPPVKPNCKKKLIIKNKLFSGLNSCLLPKVQNGEVLPPGGDYYRLFKTLEKQNTVWMDFSIKQEMPDGGIRSQFNAGPRTKESGAEEDQLSYLKLCKRWMTQYIESDVDCSLSEKDQTQTITKLENMAKEKEREIRNYYISKDINMGNFKGIQLKPDVRLPLYTRVKLAVSEEDRIAESPLRNVLKGLGQIAIGLLSGIQDRGNPEIARRNAAQNKAIFNGILNIVRGGVTAVGGKQAGRDFDKGVEKVTKTLRTDAAGLSQYKKDEGPKFFKSAEGKTGRERPLREDMLSVADSGAPVINPEMPGQTHQTPGTLPADTTDPLFLAGPGKKVSKKKKKFGKKVMNFGDFLKDK
jgi:hypothetical protein